MSKIKWVLGLALAILWCLAIMQFAKATANSTSVSILTNRYDSQRDGLNSLETQLNTSNVNASGFGKLFTDQVDGNIYAEPLYVPDITINSVTHNVVYVATENDSVYAFDADRVGPPLWHRSFLSNGVTAVNHSQVAGGCINIQPVYGITSTPVIDASTGTIYVVANTSENGVVTYRIHALDITNGNEKFHGGQIIMATVPGTSPADSNGGEITFNPPQQLQRPGLLLVNGVVYAGFGSHCDIDPWHGWLFGYDASDLSHQMYVYNTTPNVGQGPSTTENNEGEGAIWQSGTGPATDQSGDVYLGVGNGTYDQGVVPPTDVSDSVLRLTISGGNLSLRDWFTPFNQASLDSADYDLGSAGPLVLPDQSSGPQHLLIDVGKNGTIYLINRDMMGEFNSMSDAVVQEIPSPVPNTIKDWSTPAYWNGKAFFIMSKDVPRSYTLADGTLSPASTGTHTFPFLGSQPVISSDVNTNGILWALEGPGISTSPVAGILHAYNALDLTQELYNSNQNGTKDVPDPAIKFTVPTVTNGKVYIGTTDALDVYGLTGTTPTPSPTVSGSPSPSPSGTPSPTPTPITSGAVQITAPLNGATVSGTVQITVTKGGGVSWADVYIDGKILGATPNVPLWNTTTVTNGKHTISASAFSSSHTLLGTAAITVTVANGVATPTPTAMPTPTPTQVSTPSPTPTPITSGAVQITAPLNGATVSGTVQITVTKGGGVSWADVYIDGKILGATPNVPLWNTTTVTNGKHTISASAFSSSHTLLGTAAITVNVQN